MQKIDYLYHYSKQIELKERNLIITGKNGSGKTRFLIELENQLINDQSKKLELKKNKQKEIIDHIKYGLDNFPLSLNLSTENIKKFNTLRNKDLNENQFKKILVDFNLILLNSLLKFNKNKRKYFLNTENTLIQQHSETSNPDSIKEDFFYFHNPEHIYNFINKAKFLIENYIYSNEQVSFIPEYTNRKDIYIFEASRVKSNRFTLKVFQNYENFKKKPNGLDVSEAFEAFILSQKKEFKEFLYSQQKYEIENYFNTQLFNKTKLEKWFIKVTQDLKDIFENDTTRLSFTKNNDQVLIVQKYNGEEVSFSFDSLSSGFKAIFNIYANLLVRAQFKEISPEELTGIAIIDEIDVHLHISLQKKVLPFFIKAFPKIQFIVSTHSPFVITSTSDDTVVYDISSSEFIEEDLSRYSYESVIKGLFHVNPISSDTKTSIEILKNLLTENPSNYEKIRSTVKNLVELEKNDLLNKSLKNLYLQAINLLADNNELEDLDV